MSRELREDSAMLLNAWKSTGSDFFFPFCVSPFQRALESSSGVLSRWKWIARGSGAGLAGQSSSLSLSNAQKQRPQRSKGPVALNSRTPNIPGEAPVDRGYSTVDNFYHLFKIVSVLSSCFKQRSSYYMIRASYSYV